MYIHIGLTPMITSTLALFEPAVHRATHHAEQLVSLYTHTHTHTPDYIHIYVGLTPIIGFTLALILTHDRVNARSLRANCPPRHASRRAIRL